MDDQLEYAQISVGHGQVIDVGPHSEPQAAVALDAGKKGLVVDAVNKLAEVGFKLCEGTINQGPNHVGMANYILFMWRTR
jgi:hypothetical protein